MGRGEVKGRANSIIAMVSIIALAFACVLGVVGCSGGSSSNGTGGGQTINGHSVSEYNADVDNLSRILSRAKDLDHKLEAMGDPNSFTTQEQVDKYNSLVNQYNSASSEYNNAAKAFSSKYGSTIDGAGTKPTDPDNIDLPSKK